MQSTGLECNYFYRIKMEYAGYKTFSSSQVFVSLVSLTISSDTHFHRCLKSVNVIGPHKSHFVLIGSERESNCQCVNSCVTCKLIVLTS